jgi:heptosyltransferase I
VSGASCQPSPARRPVENLLVVRLGAMGDIIHTLPAVAALRRAFPQAKIGWVVEEPWSELLCAAGTPRSGAPNPARPLVDFVHLVNTKKWRKSPFSSETRRQMNAARKELREQGYELAIDFQGAVKSSMVARFAKLTLGAEHPRETPARWFYDRRIQTTGSHVLEQYHSLAEAGAGIPLAKTKTEFPRDDAAEANVTRMLGTDARQFVLINPGAGWGAKQWPAERFREIARTLAADGYKVLVNAGPGEEAIAQTTIVASEGTAGVVSCSIGELIALTRRARLFIGGDTGPLHLAAALQVPVVAIFGPTDPARNGPFGTKSLVLRNAASRTSLSHTSKADPGLLKITADKVIAAARTLLKEADV